MKVYRLCNRRHDPLDGTGAAVVGGRWNPVGSPVVYAARTFEGALLEQLVHSSIGRLPKNLKAAKISIPDDLDVPLFDATSIEDWRRQTISQDFGRKWLADAADVALIVPSVVAEPWGCNVLVNPAHPAFARVTVSEVVDVNWDPRLSLAV